MKRRETACRVASDTGRNMLLRLGVFLCALAFGGAVEAQAKLRFACYADDQECEVYRDLLDLFEKQNSDIDVLIDVVPYRSGILEGLPVTLEAGLGPDIARVTDLGGLSRHLLDIRPYLSDPGYWENGFYRTALTRMRQNNDPNGIFGFPNQITMTIGYVNVTLFEQAGVPIPGHTATWDDWASATRRVQDALGLYSGLTIDRAFHRIIPGTIAYGAEYYDDAGSVLVGDAGVEAFAQRLINWHEERLMPLDIWPAASGSQVVPGADLFENSETAFLLSGSWLLPRLSQNLRNIFEWRAVRNPCGDAGCVGGMAGGSAIVGFRYTEHPEEVARVLEYLARPSALSEFAARTLQVPGQLALLEEGIPYETDDPAVTLSLKVIEGEVARISPVAQKLEVEPLQRRIFDTGTAEVGLATSGEIDVSGAMKRINQQISGAAGN